MNEEFRQQAEIIKSLEKQTETYRSEGKLEAAKRLEFQIQNLKVQYTV